jgi:hypothetical protein
MPNVRGKNQTLITCPLDADFLAEIDRARGRKNRSQFLREAIAEKLNGMGFRVSEDMVFPPDRVSVRAKVDGFNNTVNQVFSSASPVPGAKYPAKKPGQKKQKK